MWKDDEKRVFDFLSDYQELKKSDVLNILNDIQDLKQTFYLFKRNYIELKKLFNDFNSRSQLMYNKENLKRWRLQNNQSRSLFNTLASADAFINFCKGKKRAFQFNFEDELTNQITSNKTHELIKLLRNKSIHISQPKTSNVKSYSRVKNDVVTEFKLNISKEAFEPVKKSAQKNYFHGYQYFTQLPDPFDLFPILEEYQRLLCEFYKWLVLKHISKRQEELKTLFRTMEAFESKHKGKMNQYHFPPNKVQMRYLKYLNYTFQSQG